MVRHSASEDKESHKQELWIWHSRSEIQKQAIHDINNLVLKSIKPQKNVVYYLPDNEISSMNVG